MASFRKDADYALPRATPPDVTLARARKAGAAIGVTRVADLTGVDRIGLPVCQAVRPLSRSLSVSQGKGLTPTDAQISALMECLELHTVEWLEPGPIRASARRLGGEALRIWRTLPSWRNDLTPFDLDEIQDWIAGIDLTTGEPTPVPFRVVSMDTRRVRHGGPANSNGLASGNDVTEATVAGLCELLERDALARWLSAGMMQRNRMVVEAGTIEDDFLRDFLQRLGAAGFTVLLWDLSEWHGVPTFCCTILEAAAPFEKGVPPSTGTGCHPRKAVALFRAISEAAQTRSAFIVGAREDIAPDWYAGARGRGGRAMLDALPHWTAKRRAWGDIPEMEPAESDALDWLIARAAAAGARAIVRATLRDGDLVVVKILAPGLLNGETIR